MGTKSNYRPLPPYWLRLWHADVPPAFPRRCSGTRRCGIAPWHDVRTRRRTPADRHASPFLSAGIPEGVQRMGGRAQTAAQRRSIRLDARERALKRWTRTASAPACCLCLPRPAFGSTRAPTKPAKMVRPVFRLRRADGTRFPRPVRAVRAIIDARHRYDDEGDRICVRHAEGRRRWPAVELRRQVAG